MSFSLFILTPTQLTNILIINYIIIIQLYLQQQQYWEPTKFAAALRHGQNQESGPVCLKLEMSAGHFSASDRYKYLKELAFDYAFLLDQLDLGFAKKQKKEFDEKEDA